MPTETQLAIRDAVRIFAQEQIRPNSMAYEAAGGYNRSLAAEQAAAGRLMAKIGCKQIV